MKKGITLRVAYINNKRAMCWCPFHKDNHPGGNPSFEVTMEGEFEGKYYCHGCGKAGQLTKLVMEQLKAQPTKTANNKVITNINWKELNDGYASTYFFMKDKKKPFDVSLNILTLISCGWDGEAWTFPFRLPNYDIIGIQRRFPDGFKCAVDGTRNGLFLTEMEPTSNLFITEGISDMATMLDMGYFTIARPNNDSCNDMIEEYIKYHLPSSSGSRVFIISDNDDAGIKGSEKLAELLDLSMHNILTPLEKDIREHRNKLGTEATKLWINERINYDYY